MIIKLLIRNDGNGNYSRGGSCRSEFIFTVNLGKFNFKNEHGISRNFGWGSRSSITQLWWDHQLSFFTDAHPENQN